MLGIDTNAAGPQINTGTKRWYFIKGPVSGEPLSYMGSVLVHDNRKEMEFLFPKNVDDIRQLPKRGFGDRPVLQLRHHPEMQGITWPLDVREFSDYL